MSSDEHSDILSEKKNQNGDLDNIGIPSLCNVKCLYNITLYFIYVMAIDLY